MKTFWLASYKIAYYPHLKEPSPSLSFSSSPSPSSSSDLNPSEPGWMAGWLAELDWESNSFCCLTFGLENYVESFAY